MRRGKVEALLHPASVAILGAREGASGWTARIFANLRRFGFAGPVWPVNPRLPEVWGVECHASLAVLPAAPDHLVVMLRADAVAGALREGARLGARSATVYAAGFGETGSDEGRKLEAELARVIDETGLAVSGPNCLGNLSARARLLTLPDDRIQELAPGPVAMVGQSGTATPAIARTLMGRGLGVGYIVTSGNEAGLAAADYIDLFAADPEVRVIFCMIEAVRRPHDFLAACRSARDAGKPVVALKMGGSAGGRAVALAHTGSLAGAVEAFEAVAGSAGVIRVDTADHAVDVIEQLLAGGTPAGDGIGVLVYSGGLGGLATDAAERHGLRLPPFAPETVARIKAILGQDARVANPLDAAGLVNLSLDDLISLVAAVRDDTGVGAVLMQEEMPPGEGANEANRRRTERVLSTLKAIDGRLLADGGKPLSLISVNSSDLTGFARDARKAFPRIAALNEPDRALRTLRSLRTWRSRLALAAAARRHAPPAVPEAAARLAARWRGLPAGTPLSEPQSKELLRAYGIALPRELIASTAEEAAAFASRLGFPVVVKAVAAKLAHKSDAGAVMIGLCTPEEVRSACDRIRDNVAAYDADISIDGYLIAKAVTGGVELALGIQNDPEVGPVVMFGSGGVLLELVKDVAFAQPGMSRAEAEALVASTRAAALLHGFRGRGPLDLPAVVDAVAAAGRIAADLGSVLDSMDINPLVALPAGQGAIALDALAIVGPRNPAGAV